MRTTATLRLCVFTTLVAACDTTTHVPSDAATDATDVATCAITWVDETPLARERDRYDEPAITGDGDGFLFVSTTHQPDPGAEHAIVVVERLASSGESSEIVHGPVEVDARQIRLFAGTDRAGHAHYAIADQVEPDALIWGSAPTWSEPRTLSLDPARGLGTVAFDVGEIWLLTHAWMSEGTIGEGFPYPIAPHIERTSIDGTTVEEAGLDPTQGVLFLDPTITLAHEHAWLVTSGFYGGPLRAASRSWSGTLREEQQWGSRHVAVALDDGSLVFAESSEDVLRIARIGADGAIEGEQTFATRQTTTPAVATDGARLVLAHRTVEGPIRVIVLDETLDTIAWADVPDTSALDDYARVGVAAAADGTFAIFVGPGPTSVAHEDVVRVDLRRFRTCD